MRKPLATLVTTLIVGALSSTALGSPPLTSIADWPAPLRYSLPTLDDERAGREALSPNALPSEDLVLVATRPCRIVDTRGGAPYGGPIFGVETRTYDLNSAPAPCNGIPASAKAYSLNFTVIGSGGGHLTAYPTGLLPVPTTSVLNFVAGGIVANAAVVASSDAGSISVQMAVSGGHVIVDINGYYEPLDAFVKKSGDGMDGRLTIEPQGWIPNGSLYVSNQMIGHPIAVFGGPSGDVVQIKTDGAIIASGGISTSGSLAAGGSLAIGGALAVEESAAVGGALSVTGAHSVGGALSVGGELSVGGSSSVGGNHEILGNGEVFGNLIVHGAISNGRSPKLVTGDAASSRAPLGLTAASQVLTVEAPADGSVLINASAILTATGDAGIDAVLIVRDAAIGADLARAVVRAGRIKGGAATSPAVSRVVPAVKGRRDLTLLVLNRGETPLTIEDSAFSALFIAAVP